MHIGEVHQAACCSIPNPIAAADAKVNTAFVTIRFRISERAVTLESGRIGDNCVLDFGNRPTVTQM